MYLIMKLSIPDKSLLEKTGEVDYFDWNYKFPIKFVQRYRFSKIIDLLGNDNYSNLLEIGTGSGIFIPELSKHCKKIFACDIHSRFDHIPKLCDHYGIKDYDVRTQNIEETNYPDNSFDVIIAVSVLEFVNDIQKAIGEIKRIMKTDGIFITICPMESKFLDMLLSHYSEKHPKDEFKNSRIEVGKILESNFIVVKKGYMMPLIGKLFPIYTFFKFKK